ncbi:unnamed protein product, partial [Clonostachys rhizophaga]
YIIRPTLCGHFRAEAYPQDANAVRRGTLVGRATKVPAHIARARLPGAQAARPKVKSPPLKSVGAKGKKADAGSKPKALACKIKGKLGNVIRTILPDKVVPLHLILGSLTPSAGVRVLLASLEGI